MLGDNQADRKTDRLQLIWLVVVPLLFLGVLTFLKFTHPPKTAAEAETTAAASQAASDLAASSEQSSEERQASVPAAGVADAVSSGSVPPVAAITGEAAEVALSDEHLALVFTRVGARLKRATVLFENEEANVQVIPVWRDTVADADAVYPLGLRFDQEDSLGDQLDSRVWEVRRDEAAKAVHFSLEIPGQARITKTYSLADAPMVLNVDVAYTNLANQVQLLGKDDKPAFSLNWGPNVNSEDEKKGVKQQVVWQTGAEIQHFKTAKWKSNAPVFKRALDAQWAAIRSAYFVIGMKPEFENASAWAEGFNLHFRMGVGVPRMELAAGATEARSFKVYIGPNDGRCLAAAWEGLDTVWEFFTTVKAMDWFAKFMLGIMNWFYNSVYANYGLAIIFVTLLVRMGMFPLTLKSMKSMKRMQKLAPEMERIKKEVGDDQQEIQRRMMAMYKEYGVNPFGGCFPLFLQMPVFIAFYRMIWSAAELRHAPFMFWITDLAEPDRLFQLPFHMPFVESINLLPILMGVAMVVSQKLMPTSAPAQSDQQKIMMTMMPIFFSVICYNMASGICLYILTSTLLGIGQNYLVHASDEDLQPVKKKPGKKVARSRHFYTAAQARKRQLAKETRQEKKVKPRRAANNTERSNKKDRP